MRALQPLANKQNIHPLKQDKEPNQWESLNKTLEYKKGKKLKLKNN